MAKRMGELALSHGQDTQKRIAFREPGWNSKTLRSRDATLSRYSGIDIGQLALQVRNSPYRQTNRQETLQTKIADSHTGELWKGKWQGNEIVARILALREVTPRMSRDFAEEFPKLRIFSHPNVCPVLACCNQPPNLVVLSQFMPYGSLYNVLHEQTAVVVDQAQALHFAIDIARGMAFLHSLGLSPFPFPSSLPFPHNPALDSRPAHPPLLPVLQARRGGRGPVREAQHGRHQVLLPGARPPLLPRLDGP